LGAVSADDGGTKMEKRRGKHAIATQKFCKFPMYRRDQKKEIEGTITNARAYAKKKKGEGKKTLIQA